MVLFKFEMDNRHTYERMGCFLSYRRPVSIKLCFFFRVERFKEVTIPDPYRKERFIFSMESVRSKRQTWLCFSRLIKRDRRPRSDKKPKNQFTISNDVQMKPFATPPLGNVCFGKSDRTNPSERGHIPSTNTTIPSHHMPPIFGTMCFDLIVVRNSAL